MAETEKKSKSGFVIRKERLFSLICGIVSFVILFVPWYKNDDMDLGFTIFYKHIDDVPSAGLLEFVKVLGIISIVISILYIICQLVNVEKIVPGLKKFKFGFYRLFGLIYWGLLELTALFTIIGSIACESFDPTVRIFILFVIFAAAILKFAIPKVYEKVVKAMNINIE